MAGIDRDRKERCLPPFSHLTPLPCRTEAALGERVEKGLDLILPVCLGSSIEPRKAQNESSGVREQRCQLLGQIKRGNEIQLYRLKRYPNIGLPPCPSPALGPSHSQFLQASLGSAVFFPNKPKPDKSPVVLPLRGSRELGPLGWERKGGP